MAAIVALRPQEGVQTALDVQAAVGREALDALRLVIVRLLGLMERRKVVA